MLFPSALHAAGLTTTTFANRPSLPFGKLASITVEGHSDSTGVRSYRYEELLRQDKQLPYVVRVG